MTEPTLAMYRGKRLDAMSKEELIEVIIDQHRWNQCFVKGAQDEREMFGRIMKSARPQ